MKRRIAVVTGANRGLGLATADALLLKDYTVIYATRNPSSLNAHLEKWTHQDKKAYARRVDVSNADSMEQFAKEILQEFSNVDVLVNNAGILTTESESVFKTKSSEIITSINTNTLGPIALIQKFLPKMLANNYGRIVNVSSGMGQLSDMNGGYLPYRISKTALNVVTKVFAQECTGKDVLINSVCPGWVKTDMGGSGANRTIEEGISGIVWAATIPAGGPNGGFFRDGQALDW